MKNKEIFKVGDTVYHYEHGKGQVIILYKVRYYPVIVDFDGFLVSFTKDGAKFVGNPPTLSFTPYDFIKGGFSQESPLPEIEVDTLVYVRDDSVWEMRYFSHFDKYGDACCFRGQQKSTDTTLTLTWNEWSLTNPLEEK